MHTKQNWRLAAATLGATSLIALSLPALASARGAISQGFTTTDSSLPAGSLVGIESTTGNAVAKATSDHAYAIIGVTADKPLLALSDGDQQVQVVVSGVTPVIVSDINGDIKAGDRITASPIQGVGMKAIRSTQVVGIAESPLSDSQTTKQTVTDKTGKVVSVKVGVIELQVNVSYYGAQDQKTNTAIPSFLLTASSAIAGKDVSPLRAVVGFGSLLIGFVLAGIMLQAAIRSGIISIGRNPLAQASVRRSLLDVLITSVGILLIAAAAFYLILTS